MNLILGNADAPRASVRSCASRPTSAFPSLTLSSMWLRNEGLPSLGYRGLAVVGRKPRGSPRPTAVNAGRRPNGQTRQLPRGESIRLCDPMQREDNPPESVGEIPIMLSFHLPQVSLQPLPDGNRQHRPPILLPFTSPNGNFMAVEVDVLHSKLEAFLQSQPGSIKKFFYTLGTRSCAEFSTWSGRNQCSLFGSAAPERPWQRLTCSSG
jgi:hypothetical protein